ncbi:sigma-54-dependent transcriptional regulator [Desulfopila aestuarii]|uniref:DNA-binding transcriptional response regulator, NtrC family, contains REC, AAA-type ATPase, and a Fis-type DNA-binding domains n=1 Tax=Desulfopila aestuarii DSM 18488 TaxID=1121416 RepID=A0A1M7Y9H1_9BACT|nr:sigma 54-interacting transcriptional regulator [Desulfopila aestuarii]SHO49216.1 DNA-binding transcriptional response regulator, NtrC family, contains REC, AAA-type ATPase, and a Fis-type DNA-binding domains [Desulfopila aestuarii DSM 18488]
MASFIIFPTISYTYFATHICNTRSLTIDNISVSARHNIVEKIGAFIENYVPQTLLIFAPFLFNETLQAMLEQASNDRVRLEWYGEFDKEICKILNGYSILKTHPSSTLPTPPPHIEDYLRYKKTLAFLGDENGNFATIHLKGAIEQLAKTPKIIPENDEQAVIDFAETDFPAIEGLSFKMTYLKREIHRVALASLDKILLLGETGTGKEAAAFFLHTLDPKRRKGRFGSINCAVLQEELLISELFGHEKGAFTGATKQKHGLVSELNGGTLFLDELPDLPPRVQAMLLRFLESGTYTPLGSTKTKQANTKIISAAQKSRLIEKISTKEFRQDLYYRIAGKTITLPSLNEIPEDIPALIVHLAYKFEQDIEKRDQAISYFLGRMEELQKHSWPGNVRELANYINRRIKLGQDELIDLEEHRFFLEQTPQVNEHYSSKFEIDNFFNRIKKPASPNDPGIDTIDTIKKAYARTVYESLTSQGISQNQVSKLLDVSVNTLKRLIGDNY